MAYDKTVDIEKHKSDLTSIADAIRTSGGTSEPLEFPQGYVDSITSLINKELCVAKILNKEMSVIEHPDVTKVYSYFQHGNKNLTYVNLPSVKSLGTGCFVSCKKLKEVNLPSVASMSAGNFDSCTTLEKIYLPNLEIINGWGWNFNINYLLSRAYFPKLKNLTSCDFYGCNKLTTLILGADTVCTLASTNVFGGSNAIASGTGYVYVPAALVEEYKAATNWSTFANQIRAIEDYPEVLEGWE